MIQLSLSGKRGSVWIIPGWILWPFALMYGFVVRIRNLLFDKQIIRPARFNIPVILIGNLAAGGTGKTPCVDYVATLLEKELRLAILSRGYGRKTKGFHVAETTNTWQAVGDEPLQLKLKHPDVTVAVNENREEGIRNLIGDPFQAQCILMDDGFQHRWVAPGLSILLTDYSKPYSSDHLLPMGYLREHRSGSKRADIIVVTKAPPVRSPVSDKAMIRKLKPLPHQQVFFSYLLYGDLIPANEAASHWGQTSDVHTALLITGIANPDPLADHLRLLFSNLSHLRFPDHHPFSERDVKKITEAFLNLFQKSKVIITTEKDISRMKHGHAFGMLRDFPVFYIPVSMGFHENYRGQHFHQTILNYVRESKSSGGVDQ
ncbi:MAG TPA: tetraacyldisaccharide 4'-kinase [Bacteroidales bacterium]|nr:tetraacyldisaccharide 4'-kinase [Bacteroidales bacterium]HRZ49648.1 tetraacyldisaccharide 4'-kinase [Bacteroidales bacterium]